MRSFYDDMAVVYVDYYNKYGEEKTYNFVFGSQVTLTILNSLYNRFIKEGVEELEKIPQDKKEKFWAIGCKYYSSLCDRMKACKAVYVLSLITSTYEDEMPPVQEAKNEG